MNLQGLPRATEDLDVFVAPTEDNIRRLRKALASVFTDPHIEEITATDLLGSYPAIQYVPPDGGFHLDILTRLGEAFRFEDLKSERVDFDGSKSPSLRPTAVPEEGHVSRATAPTRIGCGADSTWKAVMPVYSSGTWPT
jgi:hypothetical protein